MIEHPDIKYVTAIGEAGGQKWKMTSEAKKASFV